MVGPADTIFAHSSGRLPAAIGVIRISGPQAHQAAARLCGTLPEPRRAQLRRLHGAGGELLDEALVLRFDAPASATGEDLVELHCHGSRAVVSAIQRELAACCGLREAEPGEFTRRSFENGRMDLTEAEGLADLLEAETELQRRAALAVSGGAIRRQVEHWRARVVELSARAEAAIDYVDDDGETASNPEELAGEVRKLALDIQEWLERPRAEPLKQGIRVVFAGPPNAGKSSLLNHLAGLDRAIVSPQPGTTRDVIEVPLAIGGVPFILVDTAGLRTASGSIEQIGIERATAQVEVADIVVWMGTPEHAPASKHVVKVHGRADLPTRKEAPDGSLAVSVITGAGMSKLTECLIEHASHMLPLGDLVPLNARQAELLGETADALLQASSNDLLLTAEALRHARGSLDRVTGRSGVEDVLDALFGRFCLGK